MTNTLARAAKATPTPAEIEHAYTQAKAELRKNVDLDEGDLDDAVQAAQTYCCTRWEPARASYATYVTLKAKSEAADLRRRRQRRREEPAAAIPDGSRAFSGNSEVDEAEAIGSLKRRVLAECRVRLVRDVGEDGQRWLEDQENVRREFSITAVDDYRAAAKTARAMLAAWDDAPASVRSLLQIDEASIAWLQHLVAFDPTWIGAMGCGVGIAYSGGRYGDYADEGAVLSILSGHVPKLSAEMTVESVLEREADAIRKERSKRLRENPDRCPPWRPGRRPTE